MNRLILAAFALALTGFISIRTAWLDDLVSMHHMNILFMAGFAAFPVLLMLKVISRFFLLGFKGQRLSFIENMFMLYRIFLTKEAREEWRSYMEELKREEPQIQPPLTTGKTG
ncbi:MAG: hypothetical protein F9K30_15985 [Dechloromonas sp.]|nr:MAG: hypothetical protein F9K30_15985 [Dechloromonas sp.]